MVELNGSKYVIGTFGEVNWCRNLRANPDAEISRGNRHEQVRAVELRPDEAAAFFRDDLVPGMPHMPLFSRIATKVFIGSVAPDIYSDPDGAALRRPVFRLQPRRLDNLTLYGYLAVATLQCTKRDGKVIAMRAVLQERYGSPDLLRLGEIDKPTIEDGGILVRVQASSVNAGDWRRVRGAPVLVRLMQGMRKPRIPVFGGDAAGIVEAVGEGVTEVKPGDEVYGIRSGALAEYVMGQSFVAKPKRLTFEQSAAVPIAGVTAVQAVRDKGQVRPGQQVLVNGAGGGVGTFCVQVAKAMGAHVTAVTSTANLDMVRGLGVDSVIDYSEDDFTKAVERYDVVIDVGGNRSVKALRSVLSPGGRVVLVGAGKGWLGPLTRLFGAKIRHGLLKQPVVSFIASPPFKENLDVLRDWIEAGKITPVIDRTYPLEKTPDALRYLETEKAKGKIVISLA